MIEKNIEAYEPHMLEFIGTPMLEKIEDSWSKLSGTLIKNNASDYFRVKEPK